MHKTGKNSGFTNEELEILGTIISKISASLTHLMDTYSPKTCFNTFLKKYNSRRVKLSLRLLIEFANNPKFRDNNYDHQDLRQFLRELSKSTIFDETSLVSSWGNKGKGFSSKEETFILKSLTERGIAENIIGKKKIEERIGISLKEKEGYPSAFRLSHESGRIINILSKGKAVELIINSLSKSKLLFIVYWYLLSSLFYLVRDCSESEIKLLIGIGKNFIPNYQDATFIQDAPHMKSLLSSMNDQKLLELTKQLTTEMMKTDALNTSNHFLLIIALFKLNRALD